MNNLTAVFKKTKGHIVAWIEEIPGVNTQGKTMKEARENLQDALKMVIAANRDYSRSLTKKSSLVTRETLRVRIPA